MRSRVKEWRERDLKRITQDLFFQPPSLPLPKPLHISAALSVAFVNRGSLGASLEGVEEEEAVLGGGRVERVREACKQNKGGWEGEDRDKGKANSLRREGEVALIVVEMEGEGE